MSRRAGAPLTIVRGPEGPSGPDSMVGMASTVLQFHDVSVIRDGNPILDSVTWSVDSDQRWVILGPNGAGKTTLLQIAAAAMHPTKGTADVLQESLGKVDVFELRPMIGFASTAMARKIPKNETVLDVVLTAAYSVTGRWNEEYEEIDLRREARATRRLVVGDERAAGEITEPVALDRDHAPAGAAEPRIDAEDANRAAQHALVIPRPQWLA